MKLPHAVLPPVAALLTACASGATKQTVYHPMYDGPPRSRAEVALVQAGIPKALGYDYTPAGSVPIKRRQIRILAIDGRPFPSAQVAVEVLGGDHAVEFECRAGSGLQRHTRRHTFAAGHAYELLPIEAKEHCSVMLVMIGPLK